MGVGVVAGIQRSARRAPDGKPGRAAGRAVRIPVCTQALFYPLQSTHYSPCLFHPLQSLPVPPTTVPACSTHYSPCLFHPLQFLHVPPTTVPACSTSYTPEGGPGMPDIPSCLESQGCHLVPFPISCLVFCLVLLFFLSCHFSANGPFS